MANNLPSVTTPLPQDLQQFIHRVREALDGGGADAVVTARQLIVAGIASATSAGGFASVSAAIQAPTPPTNLSASGALANIIVSWNSPTYTGHAYTEVWAHTADDLGAAQLVGMTAGNNFAHNLGQAATRYYWARNVNKNGLASAYNNTAGLQAATGTDPDLLLSLLTNQIAASQLTSALSTRIDLIDGASSVSGSVDARISSEATNTTNALALKANASTVTTLTSTVGGNTSAIQTSANSIDGLSGQYTVKIDNNGHVSGFGLASNVRASSVIQSEFLIAANRFAIVDATKPWWNVLGIKHLNTQAFLEISVAQYNAYTYAGGDKLILEGHPSPSSNGEYSVAGKANNAFAGYHIIVTRTGTNSGNYKPVTLVDGTAAGIDCRALLTSAVSVPFAVQASATVINGEAVPAGTYIESAFIKNGTITNAKIGNLTADKITASLLNTVDFYGNTIAGSEIYLGGSVNYTTDSGGSNIGISSISSPKVAMTSSGAIFAVDAFTISNPGGTNLAPFKITNNVVEIETSVIADGTITDAKIGSVIQSTNYSSGSAGWKINKGGEIELNNATFRGSIDVRSSPNSGTSRLEINSTTIKVFEGSTLRVKIGDLS